MAGAHGGICINPREFTKEEVQNIVQKYALYLINKRFCGKKRFPYISIYSLVLITFLEGESEDVFEPNIGCGSAEMKWIVKTHASESGRYLFSFS